MSLEQNGEFSRRDFLKLSAFGALSLAFNKLPLELEPQVGPGLKDIDPDFFFVWHTTEKDLKGLGVHLEKCDVFVPEFIEWIPENEKYLNDVSTGKISRDQIISDYGRGFFGELLSALHGKNKLVKILDVPKGHVLDSEYRQLEQKRIPDYSQAFEERKKEVYFRLKNEADWLRRREDYILNNLNKMSLELKKENPTRYSEKIKVLMEYGLCHTRLMHIMSDKSDSRVSFRFPESENVYLHSDEAKRRFWFGLDTKDRKSVSLPSDNLISCVVLEEMLMGLLCVPNLIKFENTAKAVLWFRDIVSSFDIGEPEIRDIWNYQLECRRSSKSISKSEISSQQKSLLVKKLREKGVLEKYLVPLF